MSKVSLADASVFAQLFAGRTDAYGTGAGHWVKEPLQKQQYGDHLLGKGSGLGVAPLRDDGTVLFAAIDLDEPNFELAEQLRGFLPGTTWIERSRSGNAHVWAFFAEPVEGWVPRGLMLSALEALGRKNVEVFPKQDRLKDGMLGNYINLPYHGDERPIVERWKDRPDLQPLRLTAFLQGAQRTLNDGDEWHRRARALGVIPPELRPDTAEFGERQTLHPCALHMLQTKDENPVQTGHRAKALFTLAKQLLNWQAITSERALELMHEYNESFVEPVPESEVERIRDTVITGQYTSTGCDDPLVRDYVRADCPIRNGEIE